MCDVGGRRLSEIRVVVLINAPGRRAAGRSVKNSQIIRRKLLNFFTQLFFKHFYFLIFKIQNNEKFLRIGHSSVTWSDCDPLHFVSFGGKNLIKSSSRTWRASVSPTGWDLKRVKCFAGGGTMAVHTCQVSGQVTNSVICIFTFRLTSWTFSFFFCVVCNIPSLPEQVINSHRPNEKNQQKQPQKVALNDRRFLLNFLKFF